MQTDIPTAEPKVALVTGAARRVGAEIASELHDAGFNLVLHFNRSGADAQAICDKMNGTRAGSAITVQADLGDMAAIEQLAKSAKAHWNRLDVLVNNASTFFPTPVGDISESDWNDLFDTNVKAPLFLSQALVPSLKQSRGIIINIADIHAERPLAEHPVYCAAKAGNAMLIKSLAKELAPDVRVNGVAPGAILWPENKGELNDEEKNNILQRIALKRLGNPRDIARTVRFLVTDAPYITGQIIAVDGGRNLLT